jgi:hypothetical protein
LRVVTTRLPSEANTAPATTRSPLPRAPRVGIRNSLVDCSDREMLKRTGTCSGSDPASIILDVIAVGQGADPDVLALVERVVGEFLKDQAAKPVFRNAGPLLQPLDGAEQRPVLSLEF